MYWFERVNGTLRLCIDINKLSSSLKEPVHPEIIRWILVFKFKHPYPGTFREVQTYDPNHFTDLVSALEEFIDKHKELIEKISIEDISVASLKITTDEYNDLRTKLLTDVKLYPELNVYKEMISHHFGEIYPDEIISEDENITKSIANVVSMYKYFILGEED